MSTIAAQVAAKFTAIDKFSGVVGKMGGSMNKFADKSEESIARIERKFRRLQSASANVAKKSALVGLAIAAPLGVAVNSAIKFEEKMSNISTIVDTSQESIAEMGDKILQLSTRMPVAIDDLTTSMYDIRSAGISAADSMGVLESSSKLSVAGLSTASEATNIMTSAINAFASEGLAASEISDILFKTVKNGKTTVSQMAMAFGSTAPIVQSAGVTLADFSAATAALTTVGTPATQAQTQLRASIVSLQKPTTEMQKIFKRLGVTTEKELIAKFGGMGASFQAVNQAGTEMGLNLAKAWGSVEASAAVTSITGATNEAYTKTLEDMAHGSNAVNEAFEKQAKTGKSAAQIAKNNMEALSITVGTALIPVVTELVKMISPVIQSFVAWSKENPGLLSAIVKTAAAIAAFSFVVSGVSTVVSIASGVMAAWGTIVAIATSPITAIIVAIAALIALVVAIIKYWDQWGAAISLLLGPLGLVISIIQSFRRNWDMVKQAFQDGGIVGGLKAIGKVLLDAVLMPIQQVLEIASMLPGSLGDLASQGAQKIEAFRSGLGLNVGVTGGDETDQSTDQSQPYSPMVAQQQGIMQTMMEVQKQNVSIDINDKTGRASVQSDNDLIPINMTSTMI